MFILTQMYGVGLETWAKRGLAVGFLILALAYYALAGNIARINEIIRIPLIDYLVIFVLYGLYLLISWIVDLFKQPAPAAAGMD
jgi:hypothetical protein